MYEADNTDDTVLNAPDDTGLTKPQKVALAGAWSLVKKDLVTHGRNIFVKFFEEHPDYLNYFDFSQDSEASELGDNKALHSHALNVMHFMGALIDYGLENPVMFKCSLSKMSKNHKRHGVCSEDVKVVCGVITEYCLEALSQHRSKTLDDALTAFMESIVVAYDQ